MNSFIKYWNKRFRPKPQLSYSARKAKRHPYTGSKAFDKSCRSHGECPWCRTAREYKKARQAPTPEWDLVGFEGMEEWEDSERGRYQYLDEECYYEWDEWSPSWRLSITDSTLRRAYDTLRNQDQKQRP